MPSFDSSGPPVFQPFPAPQGSAESSMAPPEDMAQAQQRLAAAKRDVNAAEQAVARDSTAYSAASPAQKASALKTLTAARNRSAAASSELQKATARLKKLEAVHTAELGVTTATNRCIAAHQAYAQAYDRWEKATTPDEKELRRQEFWKSVDTVMAAYQPGLTGAWKAQLEAEKPVRAILTAEQQVEKDRRELQTAKQSTANASMKLAQAMTAMGKVKALAALTAAQRNQSRVEANLASDQTEVGRRELA